MNAIERPRHAAPRNSRPYPARHRKPNRRPDASTTYYPTAGDIQRVDYLTRMGGPLAF